MATCETQAGNPHMQEEPWKYAKGSVNSHESARHQGREDSSSRQGGQPQVGNNSQNYKENRSLKGSRQFERARTASICP